MKKQLLKTLTTQKLFMDKSKNVIQGFILKKILTLFFILLLISCKWGSASSEISPRLPIKTSKTHKFNKELFKVNDSEIEKNQNLNINNNEKNNDISAKVDSLPKTNQFIVKYGEVQQGQNLGNILLPIKGVPYSIILKILAEEIPGVNFNSINVGQKYKVILNADDKSLISYTHKFSNDHIINVTIQPEFDMKKVVSMDYQPPSNNVQKTKSETGQKISIKPNEENLITKSFLLGKTTFSSDDNYIKLDNKYHTKSAMYIEKETAKAFKRMHEAAKSDGIDLIIVSGARNYYSQKSIWERKYKKNQQAGYSSFDNAIKILRYSSMPSTSRHHWGTDIDINSLEPSYFEYGQGKKEYEWLSKNAKKFGFCQVYSDFENNDRNSGYQNEAWHWSYIPKAKIYLKEYNNRITYKDINGFLGSDLAEDLKMIEDYVNGISSYCFF